MTIRPPRTASSPASSADALLARGLAAWRDDALRPAADGLAARVLDAVRQGDADARRFRRFAWGYSAAAALLLAVGVSGSVLVRRPSGPGGLRRPAPGLDGLESSRLARELAVTLDGQRVGDR